MSDYQMQRKLQQFAELTGKPVVDYQQIGACTFHITVDSGWEPVTYKVNFAGDQIRYKPLPPRRMSTLRPLQPR
jgi:hypothetical protein